MASLQMAAVGAAEEAEEGVDLSPLTMAAGRPALKYEARTEMVEISWGGGC